VSDLWNFLTQPENREILSWIGGGLVVVCGGLWAVLKLYLDRRGGGGGSGGGGTPSSLSASRGGIAAGRDVRIDGRSGLPAGHLVLIILACLGIVLFAVSQAGTKVTVSNGIGIGGNVEGSTISNQ